MWVGKPKRQPVARQIIRCPNIDSARQCQLGSRIRPPKTLLLSWHSLIYSTNFQSLQLVIVHASESNRALRCSKSGQKCGHEDLAK
jgi:hypothetical protein